MRVDEGKKCWSPLAIKLKEGTVAGRGKKSLLCDPGSEVRLLTGREKAKHKCEENKRMSTAKTIMTKKLARLP